MTQPKSKDIEARIEVHHREADRFIGGLKRQLEEAEGRRLTEKYQEQLRSEIATAEKTFDGLLAPMQKELEEARAAEALALQQAEAQINQRAAEIKSQIKGEMMTNWVKAGGSLDSFDKIFEEQ